MLSDSFLCSSNNKTCPINQTLTSFGATHFAVVVQEPAVQSHNLSTWVTCGANHGLVGDGLGVLGFGIVKTHTFEKAYQKNKKHVGSQDPPCATDCQIDDLSYSKY